MPAYNHSGQVVTDLARSRRFYEEVLGFTYWFEFVDADDASAGLLRVKPPLGFSATYLVLDGLVLELLHFAVPGAVGPYRQRSMNEPGLTHLSIAVDDIAATCARVIEHGGEVLEDTNYGGLAVFVRDPDGQLLELLSSSYRSRLPPMP